MTGNRARPLGQVAQLDVRCEMQTKAIGRQRFDLAPTRP
jgi:hypothetical protein